MKVIITGGRDYFNTIKIESTLNHFNPETIIHGDCSGVDTIAKEWAIKNNKKQIPYPYMSEYGRAGGPIRNKKMCADHPDAILIAFPGGKGTESCKKAAKDLGLKIFEVI